MAKTPDAKRLARLAAGRDEPQIRAWSERDGSGEADPPEAAAPEADGEDEDLFAAIDALVEEARQDPPAPAAPAAGMGGPLPGTDPTRRLARLMAAHEDAPGAGGDGAPDSAAHKGTGPDGAEREAGGPRRALQDARLEGDVEVRQDKRRGAGFATEAEEVHVKADRRRAARLADLVPTEVDVRQDTASGARGTAHLRHGEEE